MPDKKSLKDICKFVSSPFSEKELENYPKFEEKVEKYIIKQKQKLEETQQGGYSFFYDEPKKKHVKTVRQMEALTRKKPEKYAGRKLVNITIGILEKSRRTGISKDLIMYVKILTFVVEEDGRIYEKLKDEKYGVSIDWKIMDFTISKLTTKLLDKLIELTVEKKIETAGLGTPFHYIVCKQLKKKKIDISEYLSPIEL